MLGTQLLDFVRNGYGTKQTSPQATFLVILSFLRHPIGFFSVWSSREKNYLPLTNAYHESLIQFYTYIHK